MTKVSSLIKIFTTNWNRNLILILYIATLIAMPKSILISKNKRKTQKLKKIKKIKGLKIFKNYNFPQGYYFDEGGRFNRFREQNSDMATGMLFSA